MCLLKEQLSFPKNSMLHFNRAFDHVMDIAKLMGLDVLEADRAKGEILVEAHFKIFESIHSKCYADRILVQLESINKPGRTRINVFGFPYFTKPVITKSEQLLNLKEFLSQIESISSE